MPRKIDMTHKENASQDMKKDRNEVFVLDHD
jgi:hypothetical protein